MRHFKINWYNIIFNVNHQSQESQIIAFYSGKKDSEKTVVKNFFEQSSMLTNHAFSLDALHNYVELLYLINSKQAIYLTQIKNNQKHLLNESIFMKIYPLVLLFKKMKKDMEELKLEKEHVIPKLLNMSNYIDYQFMRNI